MIARIRIQNYKSIEGAEFEARRVNVFIGEPNSGKSNLLEAIGFCSQGILGIMPELFRIQQPSDLFFDRDIERTVAIYLEPAMEWTLAFGAGKFKGSMKTDGATQSFAPHPHPFSPRGLPQGPAWEGGLSESTIRYYRYRSLRKGEWNGVSYGHLLPPYGSNLPNLLFTNKAVRDSVSAFFREKGYRLELRAHENEILMSKEVNDVLYSFPFESISETMRRIVFYKAALESNKDAILILDEPESNTFPFYTKYLAERIALDTSNQFFLTTHNPYVLMSIIEKTPSLDLAVHVTRMRNYRTEVHLLVQRP